MRVVFEGSVECASQDRACVLPRTGPEGGVHGTVGCMGVSWACMTHSALGCWVTRAASVGQDAGIHLRHRAQMPRVKLIAMVKP